MYIYQSYIYFWVVAKSQWDIYVATPNTELALTSGSQSVATRPVLLASP